MTSLKIGDMVTIRRGKLKGSGGIVENLAGDQIVVKLEDGSLLLQHEVNLKVPEEATIGAGALAKAFTDVASSYKPDAGTEGPLDALAALTDRLAVDIPGFSADSIDWPDGFDANERLT